MGILLFSGEKGYNGIIGTFHTVDSEDIPYQGAFAVFTRLGGSLKGHLISAMKSCEIVFIMEPTDAGEKKLARISEVFYDEAKTLYLPVISCVTNKLPMNGLIMINLQRVLSKECKKESGSYSAVP